MRAIFNGSTDPYFNLAAEEYLLDTTADDIFMLWRNSPSVIIGKNQNAWAEVDLAYVRENGIAVVRRLTGGGAVFHDLGNVNFTFIKKTDGKDKLDFDRFTLPVISALGAFGVRAAPDGRNDVVADGYKISGNAECVRKNSRGEEMTLHHGTLLFGADLSRLAGALTVSPEKIKSKGIKSVSSRVKNIRDLDGYSGPRDVEDFIAAVMAHFAEGEPESFTEEETARITELRDGKYSTWEWNMGASPAFDAERTVRFPFGTLTAMTVCRGGVIEKIRIFGDFFGHDDVSLLEEALAGVRFDRGSVTSALKERPGLTERCISGASPEDLASLICD